MIEGAWTGWADVVLGGLLGSVGTAAHLGVTRWRAELARRKSAGWILATMPVALAPPLIAVGIAIRMGGAAVPACIVGLVASRWVIMRAWGRR